MFGLAKARGWIGEFLGTIVLGINIFLSLLLLFLGLILYIEYNESQIPIPEYLFNRIEAKLQEYDLSFTLGKKNVRNWGEFDIEDISIFYKSHTEPIATFERVQLKIGLLSLLLGRAQPKEIQINNGMLYCPPAYSPTGLNEAVLKNLYCWVEFNNKIASFKQLNLNLNNLEIVAKGNYRYHSLPQQLSLEIAKYSKASASILGKRELFDAFEKPILLIDLNEDSLQNPTFNLKLNFDRLKHLKGINLGKSTLNSRLKLKNGNLFLDKHICLKTDEIDWEGKGSAEISYIEWGFDKPLKELFKENSMCAQYIRGIFKEVSGLDRKLSTLEITTNINTLQDLNASIYGVAGKEWIDVKARGNLEEKSMQIAGRSYMNVEKLSYLIPKTIKEDKKFPNLKGHLSIEGVAQLNFNYEDFLEGINCRVVSKDLKINETHFDNTYLEVRKGSGFFEIKDAYLKNNKNLATGSYKQDLTTGDYRYLLSGYIEPKIIDPWMNPWWFELQDDIALTKNMPGTNIDIIGNKNQPGNVRVYADIIGRNFDYRKTFFKRCSLQLNSKPKALEISDLKTYSPQGSTEAYIKWNYKATAPQELHSTYISGKSTLPLELMSPLLNNDRASEIIKEFNCFEAPIVTLKGTLYKDNDNYDQMEISFTTGVPLYYGKIPLDYLTFDAVYTPQETNISNVRLGFAGGYGEGEAYIVNEKNEKPQLSFKGKLESANQDLAIAHLKKIQGIKTYNEELNEFGGLASITVSGRGILGDLSSFTGSGNLRITQASLGKINLFGILSEILSITPLGLGSFQLTDISSDFQIQKDIIHFPDLNIYGPSASIKGKGNFFISTHGLDFMMNISPLNKHGAPILSQAFLIFAPITQSFQVKLNGTLEYPRWDTSLTPLGFFKEKGPSLPIDKN